MSTKTDTAVGVREGSGAEPSEPSPPDLPAPPSHSGSGQGDPDAADLRKVLGGSPGSS